MNLKYRFDALDGNRESKKNRARACAALTIPLIMPPDNWDEGLPLPQPYSSVSSRGVTGLASRILSALMPLNDTPFFKFGMIDGSEAPTEVATYLESLSYQVYRKLISTNLREAVYQALQSLIITGDSLLIMDDDFFFSLYRLDQYVVQRNINGEVIEVIHQEYEVRDPNEVRWDQSDLDNRHGFKTYYCQYLKSEDGVWQYIKEDSDGEVIASGEYTVPPFAVLRWLALPGENYGRSHCEDIYGDILSLEGYTKSLIDGLAASSTFWIGVDPTGVTEVDDIALNRNGAFVAARASDVFTITPAATMNPQVQAASRAVEDMRREVGQAFLTAAQAIPSGDRVTATAVRMIGSELETVLGGAFSSIARTLMEPIVARTVVLMIDKELLDPRLEGQFFAEDGTLNTQIVTGLQALSRDSDLQKLMQLGEMVRNLPPEAIATFRWDAYASALISSLGFDPRLWVKDEETVKAEMQEAQNMQTQRGIAQSMGQGVSQAVGGAAQTALSDPAIQEQLMQQLGGLQQ